MSASPWMKFFPQDWRADEKLRMCSLSARGLWMEMLALMHRSEKYGRLLIGGRVPTDAQIAMQVGAMPGKVTTLIAELEEAGVFSRAANGAIYSRRMTRDHKKAENARKNGKKGGNPSLSKQRGNTPSVNPPDKGGLKAQKPEARGQTEANASAAGASDEGSKLADLTDRTAKAAGVVITDFGTAQRYQTMIREWLDAGATETLIIETVATRTAAARTPPRSLLWFDAPIREALARDVASKSSLTAGTDALVTNILKRKAA